MKWETIRENASCLTRLISLRGQPYKSLRRVPVGKVAFECQSTSLRMGNFLMKPLARVCLSFFWAYCCSSMAICAEPDPPQLEKASISFRISVNQWMPRERFGQLLDLFERNPGVTDEITLFHSTTHAPLPLDEIRRRAELLESRMRQARARGYRTGVNILTTIGHHEEDLPHSLAGEYTPMTDLAGNVSRGSFCPNDAKLRAYIRELYRIVAQTNPDYIWIDDDVRLAGHMPIHLTCFCDNCLAIFAEETGTQYTRQSLAEGFVSGTDQERMELRKAWVQHNRDTIGRLFRLIERTVHDQKPGLPLGFMTGDRFFEGYDFDGWAEILSGPDGAKVRWRPGGGFYGDDSTPGLAGKSHDVGRQVSLLPENVVSIQSEIENFPYQRLMKSAHVTTLEAASHIAAGCTGAAFNVLSMYDEPLHEYEPLVAKIRQSRPFFDLLVKHLGRAKLAGIRPAWNKDSAATGDPAGGNWFVFSGFLQGLAPKMFEIGLPIAYGPEHAPVTLLSGDNVNAFSDAEVEKMLASGVYMDTVALFVLNHRGYGQLTGFEVERGIATDSIEELTSHPLNGPFAGRQRDCRQSFNRGAAQVLKKLDPKAETLARVVDYSDVETAPSTLGIYENRLGGRVCVAGYFPWTFLHNLSKSSQTKSIMRWLSKDHLPGYVESFHEINLWVRQPQDGKLALAMTNSSFDPAENVVLLLLTDHPTIRVWDMNCKETTVTSTGSDGPYRKFVIPNIGPWQMRLVVPRSKRVPNEPCGP